MHVLAQAITDYPEIVKYGVGSLLLAFIVFLLRGTVIRKGEYDNAKDFWRERDAIRVAERDTAIRNAEEFQQALEKALKYTNEIMVMAQKFDAKIEELQRQLPKGRGHA